MMFAALSMAGCCGNANKKAAAEGECCGECCEKTECCEKCEKAEGECCDKCEKAEGECCEAAPAAEAPAETPAE